MKLTNSSLIAFRLSVFVLLFSNLPLAKGQDYTGYFGKRFFTDFNYTFHSPFVRNFTDQDYRMFQLNNEGLLVEKRQWFNQGLRWNFGYCLSKQLALSVEYGLDWSKLGMPSNAALINPGMSSYTVVHEAPSFSTHSALLKAEFCGYMGNLPMGLSHDIGIGVSFSMITDANYSFSDAGGGLTQYDQISTELQPIDFAKTKPVMNYVAMYGLKLRKPITKSLLFTTGIKYFLNLGDFVERSLPEDVNNNYTLEAENALSRQRTLSVIYGHFGFTLAF
jgi:hypothetical protein